MSAPEVRVRRHQRKTEKEEGHGILYGLRRWVNRDGPRRMTPEARKFISRKIRANLREGRDIKQSVAIAYSQAREAGYDVTERR